MSHELDRLLSRSLPSVALATAKRRLPALAERVARTQQRVLLADQGTPVACLVPLSDVSLLEELERRMAADAGARAMEEWEQAEKRTVSIESVLKRFGIKRRAHAAWPVVLAETAERDLASLTEDHRSLLRAIGQLGQHWAVMTARRLGANGGLRSTRIDGYRALFLVETTRIVVLRVGADSAHALIP